MESNFLSCMHHQLQLPSFIKSVGFIPVRVGVVNKRWGFGYLLLAAVKMNQEENEKTDANSIDPSLGGGVVGVPSTFLSPNNSFKPAVVLSLKETTYFISNQDI